MTALPHQQTSPRSVRLDTLVRLRWLAILGQLCAVLFVDFGLDFELPLWGCLAVIALYAAFTVAIRLELDGPQRLEAARAAWLLAIDVAEIAMLLALTGGLQNPFAFLLVGPVLISATALPSHMALLLAGFTTACATLLLFVHLPLPWSSEDPLTLPPVYMLGVWISILLAIGYISVYAWQVTEQARQLADALTATELVLAREQHLSQLDGLAAAAAHELGTPLSTIAVVAKELQLALANSPYSDDVRLLRDQAQRCRDILGKLTELPAPGEPFEHMALSALIEDVVAPHRDFGVAIVVNWPSQPAEPTGARNPAILYGLGNLLENAVDFAKSRVEVTPAWTDSEVSVTIRDDGPGFSSEVMPRIGEPYVRGRRARRMPAAADEAGLGLGFFIAKTLLQRSGARISVANNPAPDTGASIKISWHRNDFEGPTSAAARAAPLSPDRDQHTYHFV
jgi:two-component system sensor histidine kinase RegB